MMLNFFGACGGNQLRQRLSSDAGEGKINDIGVTEEIKKERFDRFQRIGPTELEENYTHSPYWLHHPLGSLEKKDVTQNRETSSNPEAKLRSRNLAEKKDRKSTRLNSSHSQISYAVFCLKKKKKKDKNTHELKQLNIIPIINKQVLYYLYV